MSSNQRVDVLNWFSLDDTSSGSLSRVFSLSDSRVENRESLDVSLEGRRKVLISGPL